MYCSAKCRNAAHYKANKAPKPEPKPQLSAARKAMHGDGKVAKFPRTRFEKFCDKLMIQSKDAGLVAFQMLESQKYILDEICAGLDEGVCRFTILKSRQLGASTFFLALDLFWAFEHPGLNGVFVTHDEGSRDQFRNQLEVFLQALPSSHKVTHKGSNSRMLTLENLSVFRYLVAGTRATTNKLGRSGGCNYCHSTETAFYGSEDDITALEQSFSEIYPHRLYIKETTANGFNFFEEMWRIAENSPAERAIFVGWWRDERNEFGVNHPMYPHYMPKGVSTPLTPREKRGIAEVKERYGFDITAGQIAWYRYHLENKCKSDPSQMDQEMPWVPDDAFIASGQNFLDSPTLTGLAKGAESFKCSPFIFRLTDNFLDTTITHMNSPRGAELKIWEPPMAGAEYVIGADPIFGSSDTRDNGVISIGRCYADCVVQVAEYVSPNISAYQYAWVIAYLAGLYGNTLLNLEITGPGAVVYQELKQLKQKLASIVPGKDIGMKNCLKHMRDFLYSRADSLTGGVLLQWKSNPELRKQLLFKFRDGVTAKRLRLRSMHLIEEMRHLRIDGGYVEVPSGKTDDRVFGAALMYWAWDNRVRAKLARRQGMTIIESENYASNPNRIIEGVENAIRNMTINT